MVIQAAKSLIGSNKVIDALKSEGLYNNAVQFRHVNAGQSELSTIDRALRNSETSKAYNETMHNRANSLSEKIAKAPADSDKARRLQAQYDSVKGNMDLSDAEFDSRRVAALADGGRTRRREHSEALAGPAKALKGSVKDYYTNGSAGQLAARYGATAAAAGTLAVGSRYMTGGTATTNNRGQRDIAGIPFI